MPLEDYLIPGEEVHYHSRRSLRYGGKRYEIVVTDKRLILYASRGMLLQNDDVVSFNINELHGVRYKEKGLLPRIGIVEVQGKTLIQLDGGTTETKTLYQQLLHFV